MLSMAKIGVSESAVRYYAKYALEQGESEGIWVGKGAERLGILNKMVSEDVLRLMLSGKDLFGNNLVRISKKAEASKAHTPGWDLTFSAPKSVSIVWSSCDEPLRQKIEMAQQKAVENAIDYLEEHSAKSRTGAGGRESIDATIVAGAFQHSSNREKEPQLHTHTVVANVACCEDGIWRTLFSPHFYKDQKAISAIYKASLAHGMRELGFEVERTKFSFEISGVSREVMERQSSRAMAITEELKAHGLTRETASREKKESVVLKTRKSKGVHHHDEKARDFERWRTENREAGFSPEALSVIRKVAARVKLMVPSARALRKIAESGIEKAVEGRSVFEKVHFHAEVAESLIGLGSYEDIKSAQKMAHQTRNIKELGKYGGRDKFSTTQMMEIEKRVHSTIKERANEKGHVVSRRTLESVISEKFATITHEQRTALEASVTSPSGISIIQGVAGSGKSFTMKAVREVYEREGYRVQGLSPTNKAARELSFSTGGMSSRSIDSFLHQLKDGREVLTNKDILIVDEAGMIGSKRFDSLLQIAGEVKAKLIFLGDAKQIQPVEAGQMFGAIGTRFEKSELQKVYRQIDPEEASALLRFRDAKATSELSPALDYLKSKDRLNMLEDAPKTIQKIVQDFDEFRKENPTKEALIIASKNESVDRLNAVIRENLKEKGILKESRVVQPLRGEPIELSPNDQIVFTDNDKRSGIYRSDIATIAKIDGTRITAIRSDKKVIYFDLSKFSGIKHGYAVTAHKSQGTTVDRAFVYADGPFMDKEKVYVAMTRGREGNRLYADRDSLGGLSYEQRENLRGMTKTERASCVDLEYQSRLVARIGRSGEKDTTLSYRNDLAAKTDGFIKNFFNEISEKLLRGISSVIGSEKQVGKKAQKSKMFGKGKSIGIDF